jgi:peptide/nickel transport system substrate-binding protein
MRERLIGVLTAAVFVVGACGQSTSTPPPSADSATAGPTIKSPSSTPAAIVLTGSTYKAATATTTGGKVVLAEWQFPHTVNPYYALYETDIEASDSMFDNLLNITPDLRYVPDLATTVPTTDNGGVVVNGNGMDVTWNLRPGMRWSDDTPINCDDIKATWQWVMNKDNTGLAGGTIGWQDVTGVDGGIGTDCVMHFGKIYEGYLTLVSPLLPAHYITTVPVKDAPTKLYPLSNLAGGVYSGPYVPLSVDGHAKITLKPNPSWQTISGHAPWLASVTWKYYGDVPTMIAGFKAGEFDVGQNLNNADIPGLTGIDPTKQVIHDSLTYEQLAFNNVWFKTKLGTDAPGVIQAIRMAIDRPAIAQGPLGGNVTVSNNFVSPLAWFYKPITGPNGFSTAADPTSAYTILANAGWTKGPDGYLTKGPTILELNFCTTTRQVRLDTLKLIALQLKQVGIKVNVFTKPDSDVFGAWDKTAADRPCSLLHGNFDAAVFSYRSPVDPLEGYRVRHSSEIPDNPPHDGENITRINLPALDTDYDMVADNVDFATVRAAAYAIQDLYGSDRNSFELPLYVRKDVWLVNPKLHNFTGNPTFAAGEWNIGDWWVG